MSSFKVRLHREKEVSFWDAMIPRSAMMSGLCSDFWAGRPSDVTDGIKIGSESLFKSVYALKNDQYKIVALGQTGRQAVTL